MGSAAGSSWGGKKLFAAINANVPGEKIEELCGLIEELDERGLTP